MSRGIGLYALVCLLPTVALYDKPLGIVAVLGLVLIAFTPAVGRKQASAGRSSREAMSSDWERGD